MILIATVGISTVYATNARYAEISRTKIYSDHFEKAFAPTHWRQETFFLFPQIWREEKLFCIIANKNETFLNFMNSTIETISTTYKKQHEIRIVPSPEQCPDDHYSVVIYYGKNPGFEGFKSIFSELTNSSPESQVLSLIHI